MHPRSRAVNASHGPRTSFARMLFIAAAVLVALAANRGHLFPPEASRRAAAQDATPTATETPVPSPTSTSTPVVGGLRYRDEVFADTDVIRDVAYGEAVDWQGQSQTLYLDLYQPAGDTEESRPALVWVHGGFFEGGDKALELDAEMATRFAKRGWVTVSINYRVRDYVDIYDTAPAIEDAQHDAQAAVRWLRANADAYGIDPDRIAISGFSAGAVTALHVNYNSSDPGDSGNPGYPSDTAACVDISGWMNTALMETSEPPALVIHGVEDTWVAFGAASAIVQRAAEMGIAVQFHPLEEATHNITLWYKEDIILWMANFLYSNLVQPLPAGQDTDGDGVPDATDNCPTLANPDQTDTDNGGAGDVCDPDDDHDNVVDEADNCPLAFNPDQANTDGGRRPNGTRLAGEWASNPTQDKLGDICDPDDDNDSLPDSQEFDDRCPHRLVADTDGDGQTDGFEAAHGSDPCNRATKAICTDTRDADGDGLNNCIEHAGYGTCAFVSDTAPGRSTCVDPMDSDGDGCADILEALDINGDRRMSSISDQIVLAKRLAGLIPSSDSDPIFDVNKDGKINVADQVLMAKNNCHLKPWLRGCLEGVCPPE